MKIACHFQPADAESPAWVADLRSAFPGAEVDLWEPGQAPADYAVVWRPSQAFLDAQPGLKALFNAGAGVDALLALNFKSDGLVVRLEDAGMAEQMSDYVSHAVLRHFRELDVYAAQASSRTWLPRPSRVKDDFPIGILGLGVLGRHVADTLQRIGFPVHAWTRTSREDAGLTLYQGEAQFASFLAATRILVCMLPLTPATRGIVDGHALRQLQPGAYLINVARGAHVVDDDLLAELATGQVAGATLDVFHEEPLPEQHPFWRHPRIEVTPHISAATMRRESVQQIASKIRALEAGMPISGVIDVHRGY